METARIWTDSVTAFAYGDGFHGLTSDTASMNLACGGCGVMGLVIFGLACSVRCKKWPLGGGGWEEGWEERRLYQDAPAEKSLDAPRVLFALHFARRSCQWLGCTPHRRCSRLSRETNDRTPTSQPSLMGGL